jgi:predicted DsbA family dithiol-disulfide isomerase
MATPSPLTVDVWSDIACPWCYVGKRRLEAALKRFAHAGSVAVTWHSFELDPSAPPSRNDGVSHAARLAQKYGMSLQQAQARIKQLTDVAKGDGLTMAFDRVKAANTFDAHRVLHMAESKGVQDAVKERLMHAYFSEGALVSDPAVLARLAAEAGLDGGEVADMLASDAYAADVRADEEQARALGIHGVPFFVLGQKLALSGAQPADVVLRALNDAWAARTEASATEGAVCGPDGC